MVLKIIRYQFTRHVHHLDPGPIDESNSPKVLGQTMMDEPLTIITPVYTKRGLT